MTRTSWKKKYETLERKHKRVEVELTTLKGEKEKWQGEREKWNKREGELTQANRDRESRIKELEEQAEIRETKRLAEAFCETREEYETKEEGWKKYVIQATLLTAFVLSLLYLSNLAGEFSLEEKLMSYPITFALVFFIYFSARQFNFYRNLKVDMKHRETLAQSYYNILESVEDQSIKEDLAAKVVAFIASPPHTKEEKMNMPVVSMLERTKGAE